MVCAMRQAGTTIVPREQKLGRNGETWLRCAWLAPDEPAGPNPEEDDPENLPGIDGW